jgi:hypothetical protein
MNNQRVSEILGVDANFLSFKCCNKSGLTLWLLRECLIYEHRLLPDDVTLVLSMMQLIIKPNIRTGNILNDLMVNNLIVLGNDRIHGLCLSFIKNSPQNRKGVRYDKIRR